MKTASALTCSAVLLAACTTAAPKEDLTFVQREWTKGVQGLGLGLTPVYPPSEEIQVGDIYAMGTFKEPQPKDRILSSIRIGTRLPAAAINRKYAKRIRFPSLAQDTAKPTPDYSGKPGSYDYDGLKPNEVPASIVAFPTYALASGSLDQFGGSFGSGAYGVVFGAASRSDVSLSVQVREAQTYGIDVPVAAAELESFCAQGACDSARLVGYLNQSIAYNVHGEFCAAQALYVRQIYATRSVKLVYSFATAQAYSTAVAAANDAVNSAAKIASLQQQALKSLVPAPAPQDAGTGTDGKTGKQEAPQTVRDQVMIALVNGLGDSLKELSGNSNSAYYLSASYADRTISLDQVFDRPVVFAYAPVVASGFYANGKLDATERYDSPTCKVSSRAGGASARSLVQDPLPTLPTLQSIKPGKS